MSPVNMQPALQKNRLQTEKMVMKKWFRSLQPVQLYVILTITLFFFLVQLVVSHVTHALTLLVDAYHVLCNLIALFGCIITLKYGDEDFSEETKTLKSDLASNQSVTTLPSSCPRDGHSTTCVHPLSERRLKNTFGWARIDVLVMLIVCVFLASLCFSLIVESLQTLVHIGHHDEMHNPIQVLSVGAAGLLLNGLCYLLIGGYTFHQGNYLLVTPSGNVVLQKRMKKNNAIENGSSTGGQKKFVSAAPMLAPPKRQGPREVCRDIIGCIFVMVCALTVYFSDARIAKFVDPIFSIISAVLLLVLSYPYMKESCLILLQTIPDHINIDSLCTQLLEAFPDIVNVHDLHVWQLTANRTFSTAHIIFLNPQEYSRIKKEVMEFFYEQGVTQVTIQPEFFKDSNSIDLVSGYGAGQCLVQCNDEECYKRACCTMSEDLQEVVSKSPQAKIKSAEKSEKNSCCSSVKPKVQETHSEPTKVTKIDSASLASNLTEGNDEKLTESKETSVRNISEDNEQIVTEDVVNNLTKTDLKNEKTCSVEINRTCEQEEKSSAINVQVKSYTCDISNADLNDSDKSKLCSSSQKICIVKEQTAKSVQKDLPVVNKKDKESENSTT